MKPALDGAARRDSSGFSPQAKAKFPLSIE
jgi:hypothetical protein